MSPFLDNLRFNYERQLFHQLNSNSAIVSILRYFSERFDDGIHKRYLLSTSAKITSRLVPDLYNLYQECLDYVGGELRGGLYVQQKSEYNAFVHSTVNRFDIVISSSIIKDFGREEIAFVIGHELGHVIFQHHRIPVGLFFSSTYKEIPYELIHLLSKWSGASEISADRLGLLCSGSLSSAACAFFKLSSGLSVEKEDEVIRSLREQYDEIKAISASQWLSDDCLSTHPLIPIRFKSLELVALDIISLRKQKPPSMHKGFESIDSQIADVLIGTEPFEDNSFLRTKEGVSLLLLCLIYVAVSDGEINRLEEKFIHRIQSKSGYHLNVEEILSVCKRNCRQFRESAISELAAVQVSKNDAIKITQFCYQIAVIDSDLCRAEIRDMGRICEALGCEPWLVDMVRKEV